MPKFIKITTKDDAPFYINVDEIFAMGRGRTEQTGCLTAITFKNGAQQSAKETPEQIMEMINA